MAIRLAFRTLLRSRWYALTAIGTITLTIALGATVFAVVDGVLFKPLPYPDSHRLFTLVGSAGPPRETASLAPSDVRYLSEADPRIAVTGIGGAPALTHPDRLDLQIRCVAIDRAFFEALGQPPLVGGFTADHYAAPAPGAPTPAIVSHAFWRQWLGASPAAVGHVIDMIDSRLLVVGVLPRDFVFPTSGRNAPQVLVPRLVDPSVASDRWRRGLSAIARLAPDITVEEAQARLDAALASRVDEYPPRRVRPGPYVAVGMRALSATLGARERGMFRLAFAGAALIVLLGAINVAGLFAARARDRTRELAVRAALGAGRWHLVSVLLAEALVVGGAGALIGIAIARSVLTGTLALLPETVQLLKEPALDWRVVTFGVTAAVLPLLLFSLAPAAASIRAALAQRLAGGSPITTTGRSRVRTSLLAAETAIGITLVVTGSLLLASYLVLRAEDAGFDSEGLAIVQVQTIGRLTPEERAAAEQAALARMARVPGVRGVATAEAALLEGGFPGSMFKPPAGAARYFASDVPVSARFFDVAGLEALDGRVFTRAEIDAARPLAIVSEDTARAYWPGGRAVGQILESQNLSVTVIGVVEEARWGSQADTGYGEIYLPAGLVPRRSMLVHLLRTAGDPDVTARDVALVVRQDVPGALVRRAESFEAALSRSVRVERVRAIMFTLAGASALVLVAVGVAGLVATGVARRVREIGIRAALGAARGQLVRMIVLEHLRPALAGLALGLLASWWAARLVRSFLYQLDAHDPLVWAAATTVLLLAVIVAAWLPARRASAVDPMDVLRAE